MELANHILLVGAALLFVSVLSALAAARLGLPLLLMFLVVGMLAGEDGPGGIQFSDFGTAFLVGNLSLAVILLDGGLRTRLDTFRVALAPAMLLATVGEHGPYDHLPLRGDTPSAVGVQKPIELAGRLGHQLRLGLGGVARE